MTTFRTLGKNVLLELLPQDKQTLGGIFVPDSMSQLLKYRVVSPGDLTVCLNAIVLVNKDYVLRVQIDGKEYFVTTSEYVLGVF